MQAVEIYCDFVQHTLQNPFVKGKQSTKKGRKMNPLTEFKIYKKTPILPLPIALALVALVSPVVARSDAVTDWNVIASNSIVVTAGQAPPASVLHFEIVHGAVYDAVNAIDRGHQPYLAQPPS